MTGGTGPSASPATGAAAGPGQPPAVTVTGLTGLPEIGPGADLAGLIWAAAPDLADGDIVVVTSKIVSKAEGKVTRGSRDEAIDAETVRVVARRGPARIVETRHGLVLAAAGVDASNTEPGTVVLLPADPDGSARRLRAGLQALAAARVAVVISDTMGRPWRTGQTDTAIGAAGLTPVLDYRGQPDTFGTPMEVTLAAVADEIAAAAELVKGKTAGIPVAVVRGLGSLVTEEDGPGAQALIRPAAEDMFRYGAADVLAARRTVREFTSEAVDPGAVRRAIAAAITAPAPHHSTPWRFAVLQTPAARTALLADMLAAWVADLRGDGFTPEQIARRVRRGEPLRRAPLLIVPCLHAEAAHTYPDPRRNAAEREMFVVAMGAAVQNLLVALAVEGLGSCWVSSTMFCRDVTRAALGLPAGWDPMGAVGVGHPAQQPPDRPQRNPSEFVITR
jgi:dehydro coenzyme F420 reductase / coenzyme F420-0:L-glutamate ligase / coenzyme F420-1:gamma-L-glutamate ligase